MHSLDLDLPIHLHNLCAPALLFLSWRSLCTEQPCSGRGKSWHLQFSCTGVFLVIFDLWHACLWFPQCICVSFRHHLPNCSGCTPLCDRLSVTGYAAVTALVQRLIHVPGWLLRCVQAAFVSDNTLLTGSCFHISMYPGKIQNAAMSDDNHLWKSTGFCLSASHPGCGESSWVCV